MTTVRILLGVLVPLVINTASSDAQTTQSHVPPAAPRDVVQYAPDRDYDLIHVAIDLTLDYALDAGRLHRYRWLKE